MTRTLLVAFMVTNFLMGCGNITRKEKALVASIERLNSPDNRYSLYRYYVEPSMAFGSGSVRLAILKSTDTLDFETSKFFVVDGYGPLVWGWENLNTLSLAVFTGGERTNSEPYRHESKKWEDFNLEIDYYHMFSTGKNSFTFSSYHIAGDTITFNNGNENKTFIKGKAEIAYNGSMFNIRELTIEVDKTGRQGEKGKMLVSSDNWELTSEGQFDFSGFISSGVLIKRQP